MPRDVNGNYTLPAGNPVVTNTLISSIWANTTLSDVATGLSNSLDRTGASSGMTGQFKASDGAIGAPGISFNSEPASGLYRAGAADFRFSVAATDRVTFSANGLGATLVRAGDGAVGGPSFSWTSEPTTGWYRAGAGDIRFSLGGVDTFRIAAAVVVSLVALQSLNFQPTGSTLAGNSVYLPAANTLGFSTNGVQRGTVDGTGHWSLVAPSSGATQALDININSSAFSATSNAALRILNAASASQTPIDWFTNGTISGRIRNDSSGTMQYVGFAAGSHNFWIGGDFGVGSNTFQVLSAANGGAKVADAGGTLQNVGFRNIPLDNKGGNYTLAATDVGRCIGVASGATITVNQGVFAANDVVMLAMIGTTATISQGASMTLNWAGTTSTTGSRTLSGIGFVTLYFVTTNNAIISGAGLS